MRELRRLSDLGGYDLHARDGDVGKVEQIYIDDRDWKVRYFVVHTGGWLLGREVLILPGMIGDVNDENGQVAVDLTREQIENAPLVEHKLPVSRHYEEEYFRYYKREPYWTGDPTFGFDPVTPPPDASQEFKKPEHPHLRSSKEVVGYRIRAQDGEIGEVKDCVMEGPDWVVRYLEVATGNWFSGKDVLFACAWIDGVDWFGKVVTTALTREAIKTAPAYDSSKFISRDYQIALYRHYGKHYEDL